jgi:SAM-dependent methyltransferase
MALSAPHFDGLFQSSDDPWKFRTRWYETRKRALTIASLPQRHFGSAYEPGCANGELTAELAPRCSLLLATDCSPRAVEMARSRTAGFEQVEVRQADTPEDWPRGSFDLIVISELAYFLEASALDVLIDRVRSSLSPTGTVLACHWRPMIDGCDFDGDEVHRRLNVGLRLPRLLQVLDDDMSLDVWTRAGRSVASREGLR